MDTSPSSSNRHTCSFEAHPSQALRLSTISCRKHHHVNLSLWSCGLPQRKAEKLVEEKVGKREKRMFAAIMGPMTVVDEIRPNPTRNDYSRPSR